MVTVNNDTELTTELNNATGGEIIELAAGVNIGRYTTPSGKSYSSPVIIQSLNNNNKGSFETLYLDSGNITVKNVNVNYIFRSGDLFFTPAVRTFNVSDITLEGVRIIGNQVDGGGAITGWAMDCQGLGSPADDITVDDTYIEGFANGIRILVGDNFSSDNCEFNKMGSDLYNPTGVKGFTVTNCYGHDWVTPRPGAHIDCIQFLRHANSGGCEDVLVENVVFEQGNGFFQQGCWAGGDGFDLGNDFNRHKRFTFRNLLAIVGHQNAIGLFGTDTITIDKVTLLPGPASLADPITGGVPKIWIDGS